MEIICNGLWRSHAAASLAASPHSVGPVTAEWQAAASPTPAFASRSRVSDVARCGTLEFSWRLCFASAGIGECRDWRVRAGVLGGGTPSLFHASGHTSLFTTLAHAFFLLGSRTSIFCALATCGLLTQVRFGMGYRG